jgi:probable HAF family extracellular repeat protein
MAFLNERSQMVGFSTLPGDFVAHAYVWAPGKGMKDLGTLGGTFSGSNWINNKDVIVGGSTTLNDEAFIATRWRNGAIEKLSTAGGNTCSNAFQISERGEVAGQSFNCDNTGVAHATLWEPTGPAIDLNLFLAPDSNLQLAETHFVNDRGELVVVGILPDGNPHIVVMIPCTGTEAEGCRRRARGREHRTTATRFQQQRSFNTRKSGRDQKAGHAKIRSFPGTKP